MKRFGTMAMFAASAGMCSAQCVDLGCPDLTPEIAVRVPATGVGGYSSRLTPVWSNARFPAINAATFNGVWDFFDDINFAPGPWAGETGRVITQMQYGIGQAAEIGALCTVLFEFYDASAVEGAGGGFTSVTDMTGGVAPFATAAFNFDSGYNGAAIYSWITNTSNIAVPDGIDRIYLRGKICNRDDTTTVWSGAPTAFRWRVAQDLTVGGGTTNVGWNAYDLNTAPYFTGNANPGRGINVANPTGETQEHRNLAWPPSTGTPPVYAGAQGMYLVLSGEVLVDDPAGTIDLGDLTADCTTRTLTLAPGATQFYKFRTQDDINRLLSTFLDADTEGSTVNASIAMWQSVVGGFIRDDANDGSGENAQMSFGLGNRSPVGDGLCYDGRDGNNFLAGEYIIAITTGDAVFGPAYSVNSAGPGGEVTLRICSNTNGSPIGDSIRPCLLSEAYNLGDVTLLAAAPPAADMTPGNVVWYRMEICSSVVDDGDANAEGASFDVAFNRSFAGSDTDCVIFDDTGHIVAEDDDSGPGAFSQLSFGDVSPERAPFGDGLPFAGQNGAIGPGVYWLGVGLFDVTGFEGRWAAYSTSGSSLTANIDLYFFGLESCGGGCQACPADYNQDGGVDGGDVESFFIDWEGATGCSDTNQDGGVDGGDVEFFFVAWENGGC